MNNIMTTRVIVRHVKEHGNCYVRELPSDDKLKKISKAVGYKVVARNCKFSDVGYVIERSED